MLRDWIPRAVLAVVALFSFFAGVSTGAVRVVFVAALVLGTASAIVIDWLAQRKRSKAIGESEQKLREIASSVEGNSIGEVLRLLADRIFVGNHGWRVTLYELTGGRWNKIARAASHHVYEVSGRASFADEESFMIRFRSRNLSPGVVVVEAPIKLPDRQAEPEKWLMIQAEDGQLDYASSAALAMPTRVYVFSAFRSSSLPHSTLAISLESLGEDGLDEIVVMREIGAGVYESLAELMRLKQMLASAPLEFQKALDSLSEVSR